uniref:tetratricopeptide repeat-containing sensor histidine kinase n=1 Tax=uncultured Draconibacterium sp. TaxID=1573823 RepID=UPI0032174C21
MKIKTRYWPFLLLFSLVIFSSANCKDVLGETKKDSKPTIADKKSLNTKLSSQIDSVLQVIEFNPEKAQHLTNSILQEAKKMKNENLKMRSYYVLGRICRQLNKDSLSLVYLDSALTISTTIKDTWHTGEVLFWVGVNKHHLGDELVALETFNSAVQASRLSDNYKRMGSIYSMMGTIFRMNGLYDRAIEYIIKSKLNYEKVDFTEGSAWAAYLLGRTYADLKLYDQALEYFQKSLDTYIEIAAIDGIQDGVAICLEQIALVNMETGNFNEARRNINQSLKIYSDISSELGMSNVHKNLGQLEYYLGNYQEAESHLNTALLKKKKAGNLLGLPGVYQYLGLTKVKTNHVKEGLKNLRTGLDLALQNNQKKVQLDIYSKLTEVYLALNDSKNAIACQNKQIEIQNILLTGGANIKTEQLQTIYEIDEKNSQIAELEKQNEINAFEIKQNRFIRNIMIFAIIFAILVALTIYWFYSKLNLKNRELNELNAAKDKFFAIIAHDLRGPTGALASFLAHLNSNFDEFSKNELKDILVTLHKSAENVTFLLENLLIWAQSQVKRIEFNPTKLNLTDVIEKSLRGLEQFASNKQISIKHETQQPVFAMADPNMVQTIVRNIVSNAIKFSHRGGEINIKSTLENKETVHVEISDNGVGIDKAKLNKLFDITHKQHTNGTEDEQSTGLGLILVKEFVEKNKGVLSIKSEKGKGTSVSFTLPVA